MHNIMLWGSAFLALVVFLACVVLVLIGIIHH